jgi:competence protein ComEC
VPLVVVCAALLIGVAVGDLIRLEPLSVAIGAGLAGLGACMAYTMPVWRLLALAACAVGLGGLRASLVAADADGGALLAYAGLMVRVRAVLVEPPSLSASGTSARWLVETRGVAPAGRDPPPADPLPAARVRVVGDPAIASAVAVGETLVLEGRLLAADGRAPPTLLFPRLVDRQPAEQLDPVALLGALRAAAERGIRANLPEPHASLSAGVLLGGGGRLDANFRLLLQRSGLAHLLAIDGYKQVVVAAALGAVAARLGGGPLATLAVLLGLGMYTLLTGAHPSAVRAGLMVGMTSLGPLCGRATDSLTSLLLAAVAMAVVEPRILLDVGMQLSLSATLGLVLLWPRLRRRLRGLPAIVAEPAGLTLAATLATLPITLSVFQSVSLVSPLAHIVAVPLVPPVLAGTALLAFVAPIPVPLLASIVGWVAWLPSSLLVHVIQFFGSLPGAAVSTGHLPMPAALSMSAALLAWGLWGIPEAASVRRWWARGRRPRRYSRRWTLASAISACLAASAVLIAIKPDGQLHVVRLDAGAGDAVFIRSPNGQTALVVGGKMDATRLASQVAEHLALWEHKLDSLVQLDSAADAGLGLTLARYPADRFLTADRDMRIDLGGGAALDIYASARAGVSISNGRRWIPISGKPPAPQFGQLR